MKTDSKFLFVCKGNDRSKTGNTVFREILRERGYSVGSLEDVEKDFYIGSAGVRVNEKGIKGFVQYTPQLGKSVDTIFVMDRGVLDEMNPHDAIAKKVVMLDIPDLYDSGNPNHLVSLMKVFRERLDDYIPEGDGIGG